MTNHGPSLSGWESWVKARGRMLAKLSASDRSNSKTYFIDLHAATEGMFRRILFVGLRLKKVTYRDANDWLFHNDETPDKEKFPKIFDALYAENGVVWEDLLTRTDGLATAWQLWLGFAKTVRNHLLHGIRSYETEWLECAIRIDQELVVRLDLVIAEVIGGSPIGPLDQLAPRLPRGASGAVDIYKLVGRKPRKSLRPKISLTDAQSDLARLDSTRIWA